MSDAAQWKEEYGFGRSVAHHEIITHELHEKQMWILVRTLILSCSEKPELRQIDEALRYMMKWNPSLRMAIRSHDDGSYVFQEQPDAKPRLQCLYNETNWKKVMENEMLSPIGDCDAPLFRCTYLPHAEYASEGSPDVCAFVFTYNHAIIDGMSTMASLRAFSRILNDIMDGRKPSIQPWKKMFPPSDFFFLREIQALPEERKKEFENMPAIDAEEIFHPKSCLFTERRELEASKDPSLPLKTCLIVKDFSADEVDRLRRTCRANDTTIQGAAQIAGSISLAKMLQNSDDWEALDIHYNLAGNLRPHIAKEVPVDYTGLYISLFFGFKATVEKDANDAGSAKAAFWKLAKESTSMIKEHIKERQFLQSYFAFTGMNMEEMAKVELQGNKNENRMEDILYTTSYGAWNFPSEEKDSLKPLNVYSNSSIHHAGPIFSQQLITVNGRMSWVIGWCPRVVSEKTAQQFADSMFSVLDLATQDKIN